MDFNLLTDGLDPQSVPQKFKDPQTGAINIPAIVNSYTELEKKMSSGSPSGAPATPDEYCVDCKHGMFTPDAEVNQRLHAKGLTQEQLQEVYDLAADKMVPMIVQLAGDFQADREIEKLVAHFGGQAFECLEGYCSKGNQCASGRKDFSENPLCAECLDGYSEANGECVPCSGTNWPVVILLVLLCFLFVAVFLLGFSSTLAGRGLGAGTSCSCAARRLATRFRCRQAFALALAWRGRWRRLRRR